ncbi:MAG TPA: hypothetical protein VFA04_20465 [Bryobacteraceae bacterium]|nr:hypothetical protein [Bryobacteraceae bacterium]
MTPLRCALLAVAALPLCVTPDTKAPGVEPEMIGEGVVSTSGDEFGGALTADGNTIYFTRSVPLHYLYSLCESHRVHGRWTTPEILPFSGQYRDSDPVLSPDGRRMYFVSDRPVCDNRRHCEDRHNFDIWFSTQVHGRWGEPERLPDPVNSPSGEIFASQASNGNLYLTSERPGGKGLDVYRARWLNGRFETPENLGPPVNAEQVDNVEAFVAPDESYLLLGAFGRPGYGNSDLYISFFKNGKWTEPRNLGPHINSPARDYSPRVSLDGKWLVYGSERGMATEKHDGPWTTREFHDRVAGVRNGLGNLYRVPLSTIMRQ